MSIFTIFGGQTQQQTDRSRAETIARQYQQGQNPPLKDVAWVAKNYPDLLQRGPSPQSQAPPTSPIVQPKLAPSSFTGVPTGVSVKYYDTSPKLVSGFDLGKALTDVGKAFAPSKPLLSPEEAGALASGKPSEVFKVEVPKLERQAETAGVAALSIVAPPVLAGAAASLGIGEAINVAFTGKPLSTGAAAQTFLIGGVFTVGTLGIQSLVSSVAARSALIGGMGAGFGYLTGGPKGALIGGVASGLGYYGLEKLSSGISARAETWLSGKYMKSLEDTSEYFSAGGEPKIEGVQEWKGLPEKFVSFITGAKPKGLAVGEVSLPDVPWQEQVRLAAAGVEKVPAMDAFELTIAPRTGGVAYTKPDLTAIAEEVAPKLPTYFGIGKELIPQAEILGEGKTPTGFEKGAAEQWQDRVSALTSGKGGIGLGSFQKLPYTTGFSAQYGFEKPFFSPETGLTPLVTQSQLTRMGIFPDIPKSIPSLGGDVATHLDSIAALSGGLAGGMSALSQSLQLKPLGKPTESLFTMPDLTPLEKEREDIIPFPILWSGQAPIQETALKIPVPTIPKFPTPTEQKPSVGVPVPYLRSGGGERTFGGRKMRGRWIPLTHAIPSFGMVAKHFGIKGFGTRGISGDRFGPGYEPPMNKLFQASIAGYGKRGPIRESNKVPVSYKGMRMRDRIKRHERVERKLRLNGTSYPAAHRRALREEHKGLTRKQINVYEGKVRSIKHEIENSDNGDPFKRLMRKLAA